MNLYYSTGVISILTFILCLFYYKWLFKQPIKEEAYRHSPAKMEQHDRNIVLWATTFLCIFITVLVYGNFGYTFRFFILAPASTPFVLSMFFWMIITSAIIASATRIKQSQVITFLHSGFWLVAFLLYAFLFPVLMQINWDNLFLGR